MLNIFIICLIQRTANWPGVWLFPVQEAFAWPTGTILIDISFNSQHWESMWRIQSDDDE
jgi:hypothetical protein